MNKVNFFNETNEKIVEINKLKKLINFAINYEHLENVEFNVIFVNNNKIRELNNIYRNKDSITDVITFALEDYEKVVYNDVRVLGDIYISLDKASEQAVEYGHSFLREISFLMIHGFLHLLGYDHIDEEKEKIMFERQEAILDEYGIKR